ncbi:MAG: MBL fold metallo-hydrolase [Clostridia bacterium]|nr:MBL fold metallo-hydrolase [Clostridia bacterium]
MVKKQMNGFGIRVFMPRREFSSNIYIVTHSESGSAFIVDPGLIASDCEQTLKSVKHLEYILLTHGHFDHINAVGQVKAMFPDAKTVIHALDGPKLLNDELSLGYDFGAVNPYKHPADIIVNDGDSLPFCGAEIKVMHTPGHSAGSCVYIFGDILFTGDTLMKYSCGRTDFFDGSPKDMALSLKRIYDLPGEYDIYAGHYYPTTLSRERRDNPSFMSFMLTSRD